MTNPATGPHWHRRTSMSVPNIDRDHDWTYDARGRVTSEAKAILDPNAGWFRTSYTYDTADRVATMAYPIGNVQGSTGEVVTTTYNRRGLVTSLVGQDTYLTNATYNAQGQPLQQTWGNTKSTSYAYWPGNLRLQRLQVPSLLDLQYRYDKIGNVLAITDTLNSGQVQQFGYDARDRLVQAVATGGNGPYNERYGYDLMGDMITRTINGVGQTYTYPQRPTLPRKVFLPLVMSSGESTTYGSPPLATLHQPFAVISTTAGFRAAYDANGNMILRVEVTGTQRIT